jgi:hypothetical protein
VKGEEVGTGSGHFVPSHDGDMAYAVDFSTYGPQIILIRVDTWEGAEHPMWFQRTLMVSDPDKLTWEELFYQLHLRQVEMDRDHELWVKHGDHSHR